MAIEAAVWRRDEQQKEQIAISWRTAALMRTKRLPSLKQLLSQAKPAKALKGRELDKRRREYKQMTASVDANALAAQALQKKRQHGRNSTR